MTVGIPVGLGVIFFTILITGFYVRRANSEFDQLTREKSSRRAANDRYFPKTPGRPRARPAVLGGLAAAATSARPRSRPPTGRPS